MKTFEEFMKDFETDETLKAKVKETLETGEVKTEEAKISALVKIAAENGYNVSVEDFAKQQASCQELDEDELQTVAGGSREPCAFDYVCLNAWNTCFVSDEVYIGAPGRCKGNLA